MPRFGPVELILILVIVTMLFGVGKLPELFGAVGKGVREFRKASEEPDTTSTTTVTKTTVEQPPSDSTQPPVA